MKKLSVIILVFILILGCVSCKSKEESTGNVSLIVDGTDEPDTVSDVPDESGFISEEDDIILLTEPPVLIVESGGKSCDALRGTYSWEYPNGDGTNTGIDADSLHPLECEDLLHLLETAETTAYYSFYIKIIKNSDELYDLGQPYAKYAEVLEQIMIDRSDTNGRVYEDINNGENFDNNCFAISDIDGDGRDELIFNFNESYMALMCEVVYDYDEETDTLREELITWVDNIYYRNGFVQAMSSHNQGYDPEGRGTWPYLLYEYDIATDSYQSRYYVDSWDGLIFSEGYLGEVFSGEFDTDGDGLLFYIEDELADAEREYMNREEYEKWAEKMISEENKIDLTYYPMTEAEIENMKAEYIFCIEKEI